MRLPDVVERHGRRDFDPAFVGRELLRDELQQCGLARAVRPHDADALARFEFEREIADQRLSAHGVAHVFDSHDLVAEAAGLRDDELHAADAVWRRDCCGLFVALDSAEVAAEARLRGTPHPFDLAPQEALAFGFRLVLAVFARGLRSQEIGIGALAGIELAVVQLHDARGDAVQKTPVVRDEEAGAAVVCQKILDPGNRLNIEVVGRLVEQEQVGLCGDGARQHDLAEFAAGERAAEGVARRQVQFLRDDLDLASGVPGVVEREDALKLFLFGGTGPHGFQLPMNVVEVRQPLGDGVMDGNVVKTRAVLLHAGDTEPARAGDLALGGLFRARHDAHERGFAAAVSADECDAFARVDGDLRIVEQDLRSDREAETFACPEYGAGHVSAQFSKSASMASHSSSMSSMRCSSASSSGPSGRSASLFRRASVSMMVR